MLLKRITGVDGEAALLRASSANASRQRPIARDHQVGAEQQVRLLRQRALHAIGEEADGADAADGEHQRRDQHAQLAGAPVARAACARRVDSVFIVARADRRRTSLVADQASGGAATAGARSATASATSCVTSTQRRAVLAIEPEHQVGDFDAGGAVEIAGGLVGHQQLRLAGERARDRDALLLAAGELARIVRRRACARPTRSSHVRARALRRRRRRRARAAASRSRARSAPAAAGTTGTRSRAGAARSAARASSSRRDSALPSSQTSPRRRPVEPREQAEQRRLARSRRADDRDRRRRARRRTSRRRGSSAARRRSGRSW